MYNGIGLSTVRGSGTSGYVQTNKFHIRGRNSSQQAEDREDIKKPVHRRPNAAILEHNEKREIEVKVETLREQLEEEGLEEEEIEQRLDSYRVELQQAGLNRTAEASAKEKMGMDSHQLAFRKAQQMEKLKNAFGYKEDIIEGEAFDRELQEQQRQQRHEEREAQKLEYARKKAAESERRRDDERVEGLEGRERPSLRDKQNWFRDTSPDDKKDLHSHGGKRRSPAERTDRDDFDDYEVSRRSRERRYRSPSPGPEDDEEEGEFRKRRNAGYRLRNKSRSWSRSRSRSRSRGRRYRSRSRSTSSSSSRGRRASTGTASPSTDSTSYSSDRSPPRSKRRRT